MRNIQAHITLLLILLLYSPIRGQNQAKIDSLWTLSQQQPDSNRVYTLTELSWQYRQYDRQKALDFAQQALDLAKKEGKNEQIGFCLMALGNVYSYHDNGYDALNAYKNAEQYLTKLPTPNYRLAQLYYNFSVLFEENLNEDENAISYYQKAAQLYESLEKYADAGNCLNGIANIMGAQGHAEKALDYYQKAEDLAEKSQNIKAFLLVCNDRNSFNITLYRQQKKPELLESTVKGLEKGIMICKKNSAQIPPQYLPTLLSNLGVCYYFQRNYRQAESALLESQKRAEPIHYGEVSSNNYTFLGATAAQQGNTEAAIEYLKKAEIALKYVNWTSQQRHLEDISGTYAQLNRWEEAYRLSAKQHAVADSVNRIERDRLIQTLNTRFEVDKKDREINTLTQKTQQQKIMMVLGITLLITLLGFVWLTYRSLNLQKKLNNSLKQIYDDSLHQKERELAFRALGNEGKNRLLLDLKQTLQQSGQASELKNAFKLIEQNLQLDDDFEAFRQPFEAIHPFFFDKLQKQTSQKLSNSDLRYCAYLRMGLSTKEMAAFLNIEPQSIRVAKYRLKQKFTLSKESDFDEFIKAI